MSRKSLDTSALIDSTEVRFLQSEIVGDEYKLFVAHPFPDVEPDRAYPVVYVTDASSWFGVCVDTLRSLAFAGVMPPCYVIGIGYDVPYLSSAPYRFRDYTPVKSAILEETGKKLYKSSSHVVTGYASKFLDFIREELKPYAEDEFQTDPNDASITGLSFGALFACYALVNKPDTFQRYNIVHPMLYYGDKIIFEDEERYAAENSDLPARVSMLGCDGGTFEAFKRYADEAPEVFEMMVQWGIEQGMSELIAPLADKLRGRNYPSLMVTDGMLDNELHNSVYPRGVSLGFRTLFGE